MGKYFKEIHYSTFGSTMDFTQLKSVEVFWVKNVPLRDEKITRSGEKWGGNQLFTVKEPPLTKSKRGFHFFNRKGNHFSSKKELLNMP